MRSRSHAQRQKTSVQFTESLMKGGTQVERPHDLPLGLVQFFEPRKNLFLIEIVEGEFDKNVSMLCFGSPEMMIEFLQFRVAFDGVANQSKALGSATFNDRREQQAIEKAVEGVGVAKSQQR